MAILTRTCPKRHVRNVASPTTLIIPNVPIVNISIKVTAPKDTFRGSFILFGGVVIKVSLNIDDRSALVAGTGGQVAQRTD